MPYDWKKELERYQGIEKLSPVQRLERREIVSYILSLYPRQAFDSAGKKSLQDYRDWLVGMVAKTVSIPTPKPDDFKLLGFSKDDFYRVQRPTFSLNDVSEESKRATFGKALAYFRNFPGRSPKYSEFESLGFSMDEYYSVKLPGFSLNDIDERSPKEILGAAAAYVQRAAQIAAEAEVNKKYSFKNGRINIHKVFDVYDNPSSIKAFLTSDGWLEFCASAVNIVTDIIKGEIIGKLHTLAEDEISSIDDKDLRKNRSVYEPASAVNLVCDAVMNLYSGGEVSDFDEAASSNVFHDGLLDSIVKDVINPAARKLKIYFKEIEKKSDAKYTDNGFITYSLITNKPLLDKDNPRNIFNEFSVNDGKLIEKTKKQVNLPDKSEISQIKEKLASPTVGLRERIALNKRLAELNEMR